MGHVFVKCTALLPGVETMYSEKLLCLISVISKDLPLLPKFKSAGCAAVDNSDGHLKIKIALSGFYLCKQSSSNSLCAPVTVGTVTYSAPSLSLKCCEILLNLLSNISC